MKKIFRIASFALLLAVGVACSTDDVPQEPLGTYPILFRCMDDTRAVATVESMQRDANGFAVYAFFTNNASQSFNKTVKYDAESGLWLYSDIEYWIPGAKYYFKAVYPTTIDYVVDNSTTAQPLTITGYDISQQEDILVASATASVEAGASAPTNGSVVPLNFQHLLANVVVKIKAEIDGVTINSITISNIADYGTYSEQKWSSSNKTSITVEPKLELTKGEEYVDVTNGGILVIPAEAKGVTLSISTLNKNYDNITIPTINWEIGNKYTYTLEIQQNDIILNNPNVAKWDSDSATGSVIIK